MDKSYLSSVVVEVVGISVVSVGIGYEYLSGEPIGYLIITAGSVIVAVGSLLYAKVYSQLRKNK
ncbi:hypothetical protein ES703_111175 [subsurface metagenome]